MLKQYTHEELQKLYKELPEELQEVIWSEETSNNIYNICERNNIKENFTIAKLTGRVLLGILAPKKLQEAMEEELKIETEKAREITWEINRFIFRPVRPFLEKLYETETTQFTAPPVPTKEKIKTEKKPNKDKYREPIE